MTAAIEVRGLTKRYKNGALANDSINLVVERGTIMSVLGHNGAGKTTMIRQITGELTPTSGSIRILGRDAINDSLRAKAHMGVVPQDAELYPLLKPTEQMVTFGMLHGMGGSLARERAEELLTLLDLQAHRTKLNKHLSGGLKRKVLIATALMPKPEILVLDEPTTGLDPHARREVWTLLRALSREGTTMLITTHYMEEAETLSDVITLVAGGRILARGDLEELRALCGFRYKASFLAETGDEQTIHGADRDEVLRVLARVGATEFTLSRTSLEDLYLQLTSKEQVALTC